MKNNEYIYKGIIKIQNFSDYNYIQKYIGNLIQSKICFDKGYKIEKNNDNITIIFDNSDLAYDVLKNLQIEKIHNQKMKNCDINLSLGEFTNKKQLLHPLKNSKRINHSMDFRKKNFLTESNNKINLSRKDIFKKSIFIDDPYIDPYEKQKLEERKNKQLWLDKKGFRFIGKYTINKNDHYKPDYSPSQFILNYKFRVVDKKKWLANHNFLV